MIVLVAESERMLQRVLDEFEKVCHKRKLEVNVGKSNVMVFQRGKGEIFSFTKQY